MITRRNFLRTAGAATAAFAVGNTLNACKNAVNAGKSVAAATVTPGTKVNVALVGVGHRGNENAKCIEATGLANVVALCDVNMGAPHTLEVMGMYPGARQFKDFRKMFDEMGKSIEAVFISTPDFSHFPIAMRAIKEGIHVYCEKPLCRTFHENALLIEAAKRHPEVVTQMGNQGHSGENYFQWKAWTEAGIIKDVTRIDAHMNNPRRWHSFDPATGRFPEADQMPQTMDWDLWLAQCMHHDYSLLFDEGNWRCWYDFGMGALGDWGAHIFDTAHEFLDLGLPTEVGMVKAEGHNDYFFPMSSTIRFRFPRRGNKPACELTWYDGVDNFPEIPEGYGASELADIPSVDGKAYVPQKLNPGKIIYSRDYIFKGSSHAAPLHIIPEEVEKQLQAEHKLPEVPASPSNHYENFLKSCMGLEKTRSPFEKAGVLCQVMNLGVIAQRLNTTFKFDRLSGEIIDNPFANALLTGIPPRKGWEDYYVL